MGDTQQKLLRTQFAAPLTGAFNFSYLTTLKGLVAMCHISGMFTYNEKSRTYWFSKTCMDNDSEFNLVGVVSFQHSKCNPDDQCKVHVILR